MNSIKKTREFLHSIGLPKGDAYDLPTSEKRFADGGQYRFEVPGIQDQRLCRLFWRQWMGMVCTCTV